jgi:hypothetical protein
MITVYFDLYSFHLILLAFSYFIIKILDCLISLDFFPYLTCIFTLFFAGDIVTSNYNSYVNECQVFNTHTLYNDEESAITTRIKCAKVQMFSCKQCQRSYKLRKTLNRHMLKECGKEKLLSCSLCTYRAHRNDRLMSHVRIVHPESLLAISSSTSLRKHKPKLKWMILFS